MQDRKGEGQVWWHLPLIPAHRRQGRQDLYELESNEDYLERPCLKKYFEDKGEGGVQLLGKN